MMHHRPSRWLAPLALVAAVLAVAFVVSASTREEGGGGDGGGATSQERSEARGRAATDGGSATGARTSTAPRRRTYTVRPGDTLAAIAERTGVPVERLQELNPRIDPNNLPVGGKIKLTE